MASSVYISDKTVVEVVPYATRSTILRLDIAPFALLYAVVYCWFTIPLEPADNAKDGALLEAAAPRNMVPVLVALPVILVIHLLVFLSTQWSVRFYCMVSHRKVASIHLAESVRVVPAKNCGSEELVPLHRRRRTSSKREEEAEPLVDAQGSVEIAGRSYTLPDLWFVFQQTKFIHSTAAGKEGFVRLAYPSEGSFRAYLRCRGLQDERELSVAAERWGANILDIPMPAFSQLFAEHAVAPFFVFQVLCVTLWSLDDYWYYALFTLAMLVLFEAMLCVQRQRNLEMLRSMRREPSLVYVLRGGRWRGASSETVTPGEVVSLVARPPTFASAMRAASQRRTGPPGRDGRGRLGGMRGGATAAPGGTGGNGLAAGMSIMSGEGSMGGAGAGGRDEETLAPFDMLLMRGSCVVNEAMLTGESVPQAKTSLLAACGAGGGEAAAERGAGRAGAGEEEEGWLKVEDGTDSPHRKHVIFSGTKVLQHTDSTGDPSGDGNPGGSFPKWKDLPTPPDKGCPCVVLRTGFETSQGQLMKTILFATERIAAGSDAETGLFIFILLVFAAVASAFVLEEGLADETRNPFKLVLHCIMILTSVIPPELPIELSLAVINSLTALTQSLIFCTEPFRIPLAGKVDVCCFDKTGTLTSDNLVMKGVAGAPGEIGDDTVDRTTDAAGESAAVAAPAKETAAVGALGEVPTRILAGCHSLVSLNGTLVGDSVEVSTLKGLGWACLREGLVAPRASVRSARAAAAAEAAEAGAEAGTTAGDPDPALQPIQIVRCWQFDPSLRRMCTAIRHVGMSLSGRGGGRSSFTSSARETGGRRNGGGVHRVPPFHDRLWVVAKGAPESLEPLLTDAPANYRSTFLHHMGQGSRVLALAYRALEPGVDADACRRMPRADAERGLRFGGFLVLGCPMKPDAPYVVRELRDSSHAVAMITGDSVLTAAHVARQVGMVDHPPSRTLVLALAGATGGGGGGGRAGVTQPAAEGDGHNQCGPTTDELGMKAGREVTKTAANGEEDGSLCWVSVAAGFDEGGNKESRQGTNSGGGDGTSGDSGSKTIPFDAQSLGALAKRHALCVTGDALTRVSAATVALPPSGAHPKPVPMTAASSSNGRACTSSASSPLSALCCHVTVFARVSPAQKEQVIGELNAAGRTTLMCGDGTNDVGALRLAHVGVSIVNSPELEKRLEGFLNDEDGRGKAAHRKGQRLSDAKRSRMLSSREREEQELDPALVKLGDASIASPFTAKTTSVGCVLAVIRQGRCTLVTTLQVYKILALNCLTSAYMLSALYLKGVKQGDGQMTVLGLAISALFYCASRSQPMRRLSTARPPARIFCLQPCLSVLGQFSVHLLALLAVSKLCEEHVNPEDPSAMPDGPFRPNTFNSAVFLLSSVMQVNTFAVNYTGHPFMQSLRENRPMWWLVLGSYASLLLAASGLLPSFESWLQLVPFPEGFRGPLLGVLGADTAAVFMVESGTSLLSRYFFPQGQGTVAGNAAGGSGRKGRAGGGAGRGKRKGGRKGRD